MSEQELQQCHVTERTEPSANAFTALGVHQLWHAHPPSSLQRADLHAVPQSWPCHARRIRFARRAAEVDMSRMAWIGFDYDYTLAKYTSDLLPWYARALTALPNPGPEDQALSSAQDL